MDSGNMRSKSGEVAAKKELRQRFARGTVLQLPGEFRRFCEARRFFCESFERQVFSAANYCKHAVVIFDASPAVHNQELEGLTRHKARPRV